MRIYGQTSISSLVTLCLRINIFVFAQTNVEPESTIENDSISVPFDKLTSLLNTPTRSINNNENDHNKIMYSPCKGPQRGCFKENDKWLEIIYQPKIVDEKHSTGNERSPLTHLDHSDSDGESGMVCKNRYNDIGTCVSTSKCKESKGVQIGKCLMSNSFNSGRLELGVCCLSLPCTAPILNVRSKNERNPVSYAHDFINDILRAGLSHSKRLRSLLSQNFEMKSDTIMHVAENMEQCGATGREVPLSKLTDMQNKDSRSNIPNSDDVHSSTEAPQIQKILPTTINRIDRPLDDNFSETKPAFVPEEFPTNSGRFTSGKFRRIPFQSESDTLITLRPSISKIEVKRQFFNEPPRFGNPNDLSQNKVMFAGTIRGQSPNLRIRNQPTFREMIRPINRNIGFSLGHTTFNQRRLPVNPHFFTQNHLRINNGVFSRQRRDTDAFYEKRSRESHIFATDPEFVTEVEKASHHPWMLALWIRTPDGEDIPTCGAALISSQYAITAAHCVNGDHGFEYTLRGGSNINILPPAKLILESLSKFSHETLLDDEGNILQSGVEDDKIGGVSISIDNILMHPQFNPFTFEHDIALIKFAEPIRTKRDLFPICLPPPIVDDEITDYAGEFATVAGWGCKNEGCAVSTIPTVLQEIEIPVIRNELAMCWFYSDGQKMGREEYIPSQLFVVGGDSSASTATCKGDSGSPVIRIKPGSENKWEIIGLVSWSKGCGRQFRPSVWTRVEHFVNWIRSNMDDDMV